MNSVTRKDGTKEKQPELTASKIHQISPVDVIKSASLERKISKLIISVQENIVDI